MTLRSAIELCVTGLVGVMAFLVILGHLRANGPAGEPEPAQEIPPTPIAFGAAVKGDSLAPVALVIFSDFQCVYCRRFARESMPVLEDKYVRSGRLAIAFRHMPNENLHPYARQAAAAAACAGEQGHFWQLHDLLFAIEQPFSRGVIMDAARGLPIRTEHLERCIADEAEGAIDRDLSEASELRLTGTPTFFVGATNGNGSLIATTRISGLRPLDAYIEAIETALDHHESNARRDP